MSQQATIDLEPTLANSFREVVETMIGVPIEGPLPATGTEPFEISSMIGLAGQGFRGLIRISCTRGGARQLAGTLLGGEELLDADPAMMQDGMGELANMLGGSFKRQIDASGVKIDLSLPSTLEGAAVLRTITAAANFVQRWRLAGETVETALIYSREDR